MAGHKFYINGWILVIINLLPLIQAAQGRTIYVDGNATGANNGTSWEDAYQHLQDALENAQSGYTICVAKGTYRPDQGKDYSLGDRDASFELKSGVRLMGGYAGLEYNNPDARNIHEYKTILSGDLLSNDADVLLPENLSNDDTRSDNSYRILRTDNANETTEISGFIFKGGYAKGDFAEDSTLHRGGGIYQYKGSLIVKNCIFEANFAYYIGGAVYTAEGEAQIYDCNFIANSALVAGGAVSSLSSNLTLSNCVIEKNLSADIAGGIYSQLNYSALIKCIFTENTAYGKGGAVYTLYGYPDINDCNFTDNLSWDEGGGIFNDSNDANIVNCHFTGNGSYNRAGAVYNLLSQAYINDCNFTDNFSPNDGGGIFNDYSDANIIDCSFNENETYNRGGAIYNLHSHPDINDCDFIDNLSHKYGGGVYNYDSNSIIVNCRFSGNDANDRGGGVFSLQSHPDINNCSFTDNVSLNMGGGIYNEYSNAKIYDCRFTDNVSHDNGGGLYNYDSNSVITDCNFISNAAMGRGGGIYCYRNEPRISQCRFDDNQAQVNGGGLYNYDSNSVITDCNFISNAAMERGGGIYSKESKAQISRCRFHDNKAHVNGGGIYNKDDNSFVTGCDFVGNHAMNNGAGVYCKESMPRFSQCRFHNNKADVRGGGLSNSYSNSHIMDCIFVENNGYDSGGAINNVNSNPIISSCIFNNNISPDGSGAGIFNGISSPFVVNCLFLGNIADLNGGGVNDVESNSTLINCVFSGNRARRSGGALIGYGESTTTFINCTLSKNIAREEGGGIQAWGSSTINVSNSILWGNKPEGIDVTSDSSSVIAYSNVQGDWAGIDNIVEDPLFIDDDGLDNIVGTLDDNLRLLAGSPCIDAGSNINVPSEPIDLDNDGILAAHIPWDLDKNPRFIEQVDMGAYEGPKGDFRPEVNVNSLLIHEGGTAEFAVTLSAPPKEPVEVVVKWQSGDPDISIGSGSVLIFDADNYADPQTVTLQSEEDSDYLPGTAVIAVTIEGQMSKAVTVTESDDEPAPRTLFVDWQAQGNRDGTSWDNAFTDLLPALEVARLIPGMVEVYVASGAYTPSVGIDINDQHNATFKLSSGMALYGGFAGSTKPDPDVRDITLYTTILSGDIKGDDNIDDVNSLSDNAYHVIDASSTDATTILDGFTIKGGNAIGFTQYDGGGIRIVKGSPVIRNCRFTNNKAFRGGGLYCLEGAPKVLDCVFKSNSVVMTDEGYEDFGGQGGGIYSRDSDPSIINCIFIDNKTLQTKDVYETSHDGGGAYFYKGNVSLTGCRFLGNIAFEIGGGMRAVYSNLSAVNCIFSGNKANKGAAIDTTSSSFTFTNCTISNNIAQEQSGGINYDEGHYPVLTNCILWGNTPDEIVLARIQDNPSTLNYCLIQGGWTNTRWQPLGEGNLDIDPRFVDPNGPDGIAGTLDDDLTLRPDSPCIDAGNNLVDTDADDIYAPGIQPLPGIDLDFNVRWHDDPHTADTGNGTAPVVDIGAYEYGSPPISPVLYVDNKAGKGKNNGTSWQDAFLDLQTALRTTFVAGDRIQEIWVASGTYTPTPPGGSRDASFNLVDGVGLYGGFAGDEILWETRDPNNNLTILSGDIQGDDGLDPTNNRDNSYHVVRAVGVGPATILDGFIIEGGNADANNTIDGKGGGLYIESASPEISNCIFWNNTAADYGSAIYVSLSVPTFFDIMITDNHPKGIWMEYGQARIEGALKIFSDVLGGHDLILAGQGTIEMSWNGHIDINDTRIQCNIIGPGVIEVDTGHELVIESDATIELSNGPWGEIGQIWCNGLLHLREQAKLYDTDVFVSRASIEDNVIIDNCVIAAEAGAPYGQFFIEDQVELYLPAIYADGDRYLDLDPRQEYDIGKIQVDIIDVNVTEGTKGTYGGLFELRGKPGLASGTPHPENEFLRVGADIPSFNLDSWTINKLELTPNAKLNLTNRFDFQSHHGIDPSSEVLYVKKLILRENATLNTAFNTIYCEGEPIIESGARMINVPIMGFSLNNITFDDASDYSTRVTDNNVRHPRNPAYNRTHVKRVIDQYPDPNGMMRMCNIEELDPSSGKHGFVIPARAKGLFAKVNEDEIRIQFEYLFDVNDSNLTPDPTAELIVYLSNVAELLDENDPCFTDHYLEVAKIPVPDFDLPGSVGSGRFAIFEKTVAKGDLDFIRGTRMELKLEGNAGTCIYINNWDPWRVDCEGYCLDLSGDNVVDSTDFLILLSWCGFSSRTGLGGGASSLHCLEGPFSNDGRVDILDGAGWDWIISNLEKFGNLCDLPEIIMPLCSETTRVGLSKFKSQSFSDRLASGNNYNDLEDLLILGKKDASIDMSMRRLDDDLYSFNSLGKNPKPITLDAIRCNVRLVRDSESRKIYRINTNSGIWKLNENNVDDECVIYPYVFEKIPQPHDSNTATVYVGIQGEGFNSYGRPILDAVIIGNVAYIVPVVVKPETGEAYVAAAQLELLTNGNGYDIIQLYDPYEPQQPNELREIEVDEAGNVYVLRACEGNDTLWKFTPDGNTKPYRLDLGNFGISNPTAMHVSDNANRLYITSWKYDPSGVLPAKVYSLSLGEGLSLQQTISINNLQNITSITEDPINEILWIVGFNIDYALVGFDYIQEINNPDFYSPYWVPVSYNNNVGEIVTNNDNVDIDAYIISGQHNLALPTSIVWTGERGNSHYEPEN